MLNRPDCRKKEGGKGAAGERVKVKVEQLGANTSINPGQL
jgi:hypothetical protein